MPLYSVPERAQMLNNDQTEVLVVGAGPVGLLTALLLRRHGIGTRIIDQKTRTALHSYACALHPASLCILEQAGILEDAIAMGRRVETVGLYEGAERRAQAALADIPSFYPFVLVLGQFLLEELLEDELRAAGVRVEWGRRLRGIEQGADEVEARVEKLQPIGRGGIIPDFEEDPQDCFQIHADFVVGADGHNSQLRRQLGIGLAQTGSPQMYGVYEIETVEPVDHEMKLVVSDAGISVLWPMTNNRCRWSFQIVPPEAPGDSLPDGRELPIRIEPPIEGDSLHELGHFLADRAPWFRHQIKDILWIARAQFERQLAVQFGAGRCWLAGDAAHQAGPAGMQSMNAGLGEAADLADKLKSILRSHSKADLMGSYDLLHRRQWERLPGLNGLAGQPGCLSPWARGHFSILSESLPASGEDLSRLLEKL